MRDHAAFANLNHAIQDPQMSGRSTGKVLFHLIDTICSEGMPNAAFTRRNFGTAGRMQKATWVRWAAACLAVIMLDGNGGPAKREAMLPDRLLTCRIGHVTNLDPQKDQTMAELRFDGVHDFSLFLPGIPALKGIPRDASEEAPPVDPRTRIVTDPDDISGQPDHSFGRIVDLWPERVELSATIAGPLLNTIVINPIDIANNDANLFMMRATELTHFDAKHIYQGHCRITVHGARPFARG